VRNILASAEGLGRKVTWFLQQIPMVKNYVGGVGPAWFLLVRGTIVCIDDLERRGKGLSIRDILGLASHLKERRQCKVFLVLNDEALEEDKKEFDTYYEKVVDTSLRFAPSPQECAEIALANGTRSGRLLGGYCVELGISA
jgi:hypothetical protein